MYHPFASATERRAKRKFNQCVTVHLALTRLQFWNSLSDRHPGWSYNWSLDLELREPTCKLSEGQKLRLGKTREAKTYRLL